MNTVIVANGLFPQKGRTLNILKKADKIICCDGAINNLIKTGVSPDIIIGDLDSITDFAREIYKDKIIHISDQNTNDLTKAVNFCIDNNLKNITIIGATGKREDHAIANIALLSKYSEKVNVKIVSDYGEFIPLNKSANIKSFKGQQVSIFSLTPETKISSINLKYPLNNYQLEYWWQGTLNECLYDNFTLEFDKGKLIVYLLFEE